MWQILLKRLNLLFCCGTRSSFTREELMNIRGTTPVDLFPTLFCHQWNYWTFWSKVPSPLYMPWNADSAHRYREYFFPTCVHCATTKQKGGGICFYINSGWCNSVTVIQQHCSPDLEYFFINCKPFYSPREFVSFILVCVYISLQTSVQEAQRMLADQILSVVQTHPYSLVTVLSDFNKGNLSHELPKYRQYVKCPTREENGSLLHRSKNCLLPCHGPPDFCIQA